MSEVSRASALFWLPLVPPEVPVPQTEFVPYDHREAVAALGGERPRGWWRKNITLPLLRVVQGFKRPVFLRTDLASAKHDGSAAYRVDRARADLLARVAAATVEDSEMKFWLQGPTPAAFMVREWLDLDVAFTAFQGHGIAREYRAFVEAGRVLCLHPYWPPDAIRNPSVEDWRVRLNEMYERTTDREFALLAEWAKVVSGAIEQSWSVDFAADATGGWWMIDMAPAEESWHPPH